MRFPATVLLMNSRTATWISYEKETRFSCRMLKDFLLVIFALVSLKFLLLSCFLKNFDLQQVFVHGGCILEKHLQKK